jgi:predicted Co/Zn/Cd cation transporter (cation efflux family)
MNQVTRKKLWKGFILFTLVTNILGMVLGVWVGSTWIAFGHGISAVVSTLVYLETFDKGPEDNDDEQ